MTEIHGQFRVDVSPDPSDPVRIRFRPSGYSAIWLDVGTADDLAHASDAMVAWLANWDEP